MRPLWFVLLIGAASWAFGQPRVPRAKEAAALPAGATIRFDDLVKSSRIGFQQRSSLSPQRYLIETMTGGVAAFDYDNDGWLDLFFTNGAAIPSLEKTGPEYWNRLYHNNGERSAWRPVCSPDGSTHRSAYRGSVARLSSP